TPLGVVSFSCLSPCSRAARIFGSSSVIASSVFALIVYGSLTSGRGSDCGDGPAGCGPPRHLPRLSRGTPPGHPPRSTAGDARFLKATREVGSAPAVRILVPSGAVGRAPLRGNGEDCACSAACIAIVAPRLSATPMLATMVSIGGPKIKKHAITMEQIAM